MKNRTLFFMIFAPLFCFAQVNETFLDGNFINNPKWEGTDTNFKVNSSHQLQSNATTTSTSYVLTASEAIENASWEAWVKITYTTSSSNYASIILASDKMDILNGFNGYYVQIGGTNDEVSLFLQEGSKKTKIIDGADKRTDGNPIEMRIKVTRENTGRLTLYSKLITESEYTVEGTANCEVVKSSSYFGLLFSNTSSTGSNYYFDDIVVTGEKFQDLETPKLNTLKIVQPNKLLLNFSEAMDFSTATYSVSNDMGTPASSAISDTKTSIELSFSSEFDKGKIYKLQISELKDLAGNLFIDTEKETGIIEPVESGDLVFNEVMFENPDDSKEYVEFYNNSNKVLDVSNLIFTTSKNDSMLNTGVKFPIETIVLPHSYLALCSDAETVRKYYNCAEECKIRTTDNWSNLNNETTTLVLTNAAKDTIFDALTYSSKWHHVLVKNTKGVALEKVNPELPSNNISSWHSAGSDSNYGTPGMKNSQYRELATSNAEEKIIRAEPEAFSPDNDGVDDICVIHYKTNSNGYVANATIFNAVGVKIYQLISNSLLSSEGFVTWDGKTTTGKNANVGIYVIYFELFNPETGERKIQKIPVVVSSI